MVKDYFNAINSLFNHSCNVYNFVPKFDENTKQTFHKKECIIENEPCRVSFKNISSSSNEKIGSSSQQIKLFISNDIEIKEGSIIEVNVYGEISTYKHSGIPARYSNHQEIILEKEEFN